MIIYSWLLFVCLLFWCCGSFLQMILRLHSTFSLCDVFSTWKSLPSRKGWPCRRRPSLSLCFISLLDSSSSLQREMIIPLEFGTSVLPYFITLWHLSLFDWGSGCSSPSSKHSAMLILPVFPFFFWSRYRLSQSHCRLVCVAIPDNSRNLVQKSSYSDEQK